MTPVADVGADWDLTDLYACTEDWEKHHDELHASVSRIDAFRGTLSRSAQDLFSALSAISSLNEQLQKLAAFAELKADEDLRVAANQERLGRADALRALSGRSFAWLGPEIVAIGESRIAEFLRDHPGLAVRFRRRLENILRVGSRWLSADAERLLAVAESQQEQFVAVHRQLADRELPFPTVSLSDGASVRLDPVTFRRCRRAASRADRQLTQEKYWAGVQGVQESLGTLLTAYMTGTVAAARTRGFSSALAHSLFKERMSSDAYSTLMSKMDEYAPLLRRYLQVRAKCAGLDGAARPFDWDAPIAVEAAAPSFERSQATGILLNALQPLGTDYVSRVQFGLNSNWMSWQPRAGKVSAAYCHSAAYDGHSYVCISFAGDMPSVKSLAHEWGHAIHSELAKRAQPFELASFPRCIGETAAFVNQLLVSDYLLAHARSDEERLWCIVDSLDEIHHMFFRQARIAKFEESAHACVEAGEQPSGERLSSLYLKSLIDLYGDDGGDYGPRSVYGAEWGVMRHLYRRFYVYQYALAFTAASCIVEQLHADGSHARDRYLDMCRRGGSADPAELLKCAGANMESEEPYRLLGQRMSRLIEECEWMLEHRIPRSSFC